MPALEHESSSALVAKKVPRVTRGPHAIAGSADRVPQTNDASRARYRPNGKARLLPAARRNPLLTPKGKAAAYASPRGEQQPSPGAELNAAADDNGAVASPPLPGGAAATGHQPSAVEIEPQKRGAVVHHEPETLEQLEPTITRLAQRLVLADRLCGPPRADQASYTTHLNPRGHKPRVPMIGLNDQEFSSLSHHIAPGDNGGDCYVKLGADAVHFESQNAEHPALRGREGPGLCAIKHCHASGQVPLGRPGSAQLVTLVSN